MNSIMRTLMLSCKKAATLVDKKQLVKLTWVENMQLRMHTSMCAACEAYKKQSKFIDAVLLHQSRLQTDSTDPALNNPELKAKIISKL